MVEPMEHQIQKALYEIADAASAVTDMQSFYQRLHKIVGELMYAKSFYVTLYDEATGLLSSPYFADESGDEPPPPTKIDKTNKSLRAQVLLQGKTLHVSGTEIEEGRLLGKFEPMGTPAEDWVGVPLKMDGQVIGSLTVQSYEKGVRYEEQDVCLLEFVAQHIAVALTRARAIEETRQRNMELQVINSVQEGLASNLDIQSIYTLVGDKLREIFAADTTFIAFKDDATDLLYVNYYADRVLRRSFNRPYGTGIAEVIIDSSNPLLLRNEMEQQERGALHVVSPGAEKDLNQSVLGVPIFRGGKACGAVTVQSYQVNAFDENDLRLLQTLTNAMSVALENALLFTETQRLLKETEQRNAELAIINSVQQGLASKLEMQAIYELVGEKIRQTFKAQVVSIVTWDQATQLMYGRYYFENGRVLPGITLPSFGFRKHVVENGKPIIINGDMPRWIEVYDNPVLQGAEPKSAIFIPMNVGEETIGVISLQNNDQENAFTEADVRLLTTLANSMSVALENARLWEQEKLYRKALERELEIGREIQAGFLPEELPLVEGWEIAASLMSAREVAGDFYDAFQLPGGNIGLVIADVCDKGVGAALFMTLFRSLIRITANQKDFEHSEHVNVSQATEERLQRAMTLTNNYIAETHQKSGMFATIFFGILNPLTGQLMYINGGHEPPLIVRSGPVCEPLCKTGPAVGALLNCHFDVSTAQLNPGEMLFAFTDGAPEAKDPSGEFFGRERLLDTLRRYSASAQELVRSIEDELHHYIDKATQFDDITLLAVKWVPQPHDAITH